MDLPERIAILTRELPPEKQEEVLDFVEFLCAKRASSVIASGAPTEAPPPPPPPARGAKPGVDEPDWSPLDIEPAEFRDVELDE